MSGGRRRDEAGADIVRVCRRLYGRGLVAGPDGNVSVRRLDGTILVTPSGMSKVDVSDEDLVMVDPEGRKALLKLSQLPPQSKQAASLLGYVTALSNSGADGEEDQNNGSTEAPHRKTGQPPP